MFLDLAGGDHLLSHLGAGRAAVVVGELAEGDQRNIQVNVDAVQQRSADSRQVPLDLLRLQLHCLRGSDR